MGRIFITGSTDGLGRAAAKTLMDEGHEVVLHARSADRASAVADLAGRAAGVVIGDLASALDTRKVANQVNAIGPMDAIIHNAGVYQQSSRNPTPEGHATTLAINTLAPYMLTALIERPSRLIYLSSGLHRGGEGSLPDIDWTERRWDAGRAYAETKLQVIALAIAVARRWLGRPEQRRRSGLGAHQDGRRRCAARHLDRTAHPGVAGGQRRARGEGQRPVLARHETGHARRRSPRPGLPGPAAGQAGATDRHRTPLTRGR